MASLFSSSSDEEKVCVGSSSGSVREWPENVAPDRHKSRSGPAPWQPAGTQPPPPGPPLPYHPSSELNNRAGYYPHLSDTQLSAAHDVLAMVAADTALAAPFTSDDAPEHPFLKALRFLRARKWDVHAAVAMIRDDVAWRAEPLHAKLRRQTADEVLQCPFRDVFQFFPTWVQGFDTQGRPISWRQFGKFEIWNVLKETSMERLVAFHAWESEQMLRLMANKSAQTGHTIENFTIVVDAADWHLGLAIGDAYTFVQAMVQCDSDHYPERLGRLVVINAPLLLSIVFNFVATFLDEVQMSKISMHSSPDEWQPILRSFIDEDQIPTQYGGTMAFNLDAALNSMNPPPEERDAPKN
jgi:hypothetical protein